MAIFSIPIPSLAGASATVYARIDRTGQLWNTGGTPAFEAPLVANVASYTIAMTEADTAGGGTGFFTGTFPAGIPASARVGVTAYQQAGASAAFTDPIVGDADYGWDGTTLGIAWANVVEVNQATITGGVPAVNVTEVNGSAVTAGIPAVNVTEINGGSVTTPSVIDTNMTQVAGQTVSAAAPVTFPATIAAPGDAMTVSVGTGAGQINASGGKVPATLAAADVTGDVAANVTQVGGQTASAAAPVTFPASIGTSTYAGGAVASVTAGVTLASGAITQAAFASGVQTPTAWDGYTAFSAASVVAVTSGSIFTVDFGTTAPAALFTSPTMMAWAFDSTDCVSMGQKILTATAVSGQPTQAALTFSVAFNPVPTTSSKGFVGPFPS